jgi:transcriptional regulator with XRE-family HTH domain
MKTGERIKALRNGRGMTQEELGEKLGLKKAAINKYESGAVVNIKRSTIAKMAEIFDVSPAYLMGIDDRKKLTIEQSISELNAEDKELFEKFKMLDSDKKRLVDLQIQAWLENE